MFIKQLTLINFKNIRQAELDFSPKINCLIGFNGAGKTNILDAIYYLSYCKSSSNNIDSQNITHEEDFFVIQGKYQTDAGGEENIYCGLKRKQKKQFKRNKKEYNRLSEHIGMLPLVLVSPNDQKLISEGSEERRRFMDSIISQYDHEYLQALINYNNALVQRNVLLKKDMRDNSLFDIWEEQMADFGLKIYNKRISFINDFLPIFQHLYEILSMGREKVSLTYRSQLSDRDLLASLSQSRERDIILGHSTVGIHRDELDMQLGDYPIKRVGSQGQNKTYLIALKLAQFSFIRQISGVMPLLLLDDIFDKLDSHRVKQIIDLVSEEHFGQIFITDTNREHLDDILNELRQDSKLYCVENGEVDLFNK